MPPRSRGPPGRRQPSLSTIITALRTSIGLLTLAAISSPISQATLAPVFGAIPSAINHHVAVIASALLGFNLGHLCHNVGGPRVAQWTAIWTFWIPVVQMYLFRYSSTLGLVGGPALIGFLSCHMIIVPSVYAAANALEALNLKTTLGAAWAVFLSTTLGVFYLTSVETWFQAELPGWMAESDLLNPIQLQLVLAVAYVLLARSKWTILIVPALLHTSFRNPHFHAARTFSLLDQTLRAHNWTILDRSWSNTGYISVLENVDLQYRALRCDHSLLGGEWQITEARRAEGWTVNEPIFAVFDMLEAVRLIEMEPMIPDREAHALIIGLGIGTAPKAFFEHGIESVVLELDPVVEQYARKHFGLPREQRVEIADAVQWVSRTPKLQRFNYIIHDVFTGGAEPLALFTEKFLSNLRALLEVDGVIALNYAGTLNALLTTRALNTIYKVFDGQCRLFRESPAEDKSIVSSAATDDDFSNIVVFCRNSPGPITFRNPIEADFLGSWSRRQHLLPKPESEIQFPRHRQGVAGEAQRSESHPQVLKAGEEKSWLKQQAESAKRHWHVMRREIPDAVWELW